MVERLQEEKSCQRVVRRKIQEGECEEGEV